MLFEGIELSDQAFPDFAWRVALMDLHETYFHR
jgi:hypothetical protein